MSSSDLTRTKNKQIIEANYYQSKDNFLDLSLFLLDLELDLDSDLGRFATKSTFIICTVLFRSYHILPSHIAH